MSARRVSGNSEDKAEHFVESHFTISVSFSASPLEDKRHFTTGEVQDTVTSAHVCVVNKLVP